MKNPLKHSTFENNWNSKTLEALEKDYWNDPGICSNLVLTCHKLRKIQLKEFDAENLRIMIGQQIGLKFLIPLALEKLGENIMAMGDFYEGDLLAAVLSVKADYWKANPALFIQLDEIVNENEKRLIKIQPRLHTIFLQQKESIKGI